MADDAIDIDIKHKKNMEKAELLIPVILEEVGAAIRKFPLWPTDPLHAKAVLDEEVGELEKAVLQRMYEPEKATKEDIEKEAIQAAAMSIRFLISLDKYDYTPREQHDQGSL